MHIAIIFPMETVRISYEKPEYVWGRAVANHSFLLGLIESAMEHQITLFVQTRADIELLRKTLLANHDSEIAVVPTLEIPSFLRQAPIDVLHNLDPNMAISAHIRNSISENTFVITGLTHSLANKHFLSWALRGSANGITETDCLICTTPTAKTVIDSAFSRMHQTQPGFSAPQTAVIPLGTSAQPYRDGQKPDRSRFGLKENEFVILSLARFNPQFKFDYLPLLNLLQLLLGASDQPIRLVLAGASDDGSYSDLVKNWVDRLDLQESVRFVLDPTDSTKAELYKAADVFLTLSDNIQETFGLTVVEALASGLPVVASDWNGYKALIEDGVTGFLVPTMTLAPDVQWEATLSLLEDSAMHMYCAQTTAVDLPAACASLLKIADDEDLANRMRKAASESASRYDWSVVTGEYVDLWTKLVSENRQKNKGVSKTPARSSNLRVLEDFAEYPTSQLSTDECFVTSALGRQVIQRKRQLYLYGQLAEIMNLRILNGLLALCSIPRETRFLFDHAGKNLETSDSEVSINLMWLYKYGLIERI